MGEAGSETRSEDPPAVKKVTECQLKDYSWDQSEKFVKLYLTGLAGLANCSNEEIVINYSGESVSVRLGPLPSKDNKIFTFGIKKTCHKINPEKSYHKVKSDYLILHLAKMMPGICQNITDTKQEFVDHIKSVHSDQVDESVLQSLESDPKKRKRKELKQRLERLDNVSSWTK